MPHMYSSRSRLFWMGFSWKKGTLGAVRGTSTMTCSHRGVCRQVQTEQHGADASAVGALLCYGSTTDPAGSRTGAFGRSTAASCT